ncbi:MAG: glycerol-3-phosphate 1-O-acyltransferase PlsY [Nitrospiria bacterium]
MILANYLAGSLPFGLMIAKVFRGIDPREKGSGNIGATNVLRVAGKKAAVATLIFDLIKGLPFIFAARLAGFENRIVLLVGLAAILGHIFSVFLRFKGGKGVATSFGVILVLTPQVAIAGLLFWGGGVFFGKYSSVGALTAFGILPLLTFFFNLGADFVIFSIIVTLLVYFRHWENIRRLLQGREGTV